MSEQSGQPETGQPVRETGPGAGGPDTEANPRRTTRSQPNGAQEEAADHEPTLAESATRPAGDDGRTDEPDEQAHRTEEHDPEGDGHSFPFGRPGRPLATSPLVFGFLGGLGVLLAIALTQALIASRQVLVLIVVSMFLAVGLNPSVEWLQRHGFRRGLAVATVFLGLVLFFVGFGFAIAPPLAEQSTDFATNLPEFIDEIQSNRTVQDLDQRFQIIDRLQEFATNGQVAPQAFGGIIGVGKVVLSATFSALTVLILTLYFITSLPNIKRACYNLVPRSRRNRVQLLGDEILTRVGGYVSGALVVAGVAGVSTFLFLQIIGLREYALPLSLVVALFALIPLIGATLGAIAVTIVGFFDSIVVGIACLVFFIVYQQIENYIIYPRVMRRSVDVPPALTIVAALLGGALLGVVGALLAIPTAAAVLLIVREVVVPRQERT